MDEKTTEIILGILALYVFITCVITTVGWFWGTPILDADDIQEAVKQATSRYIADLEAQIQSLSISLIEMNKTCDGRLNAMNKKSQEMEEEMLKLQNEFLAKMMGVDFRQDFILTFMQQLGFMKLDTWGPVLLLVAVLEAVLFAVVYRLRSVLSQEKRRLKAR